MYRLTRRNCNRLILRIPLAICLAALHGTFAFEARSDEGPETERNIRAAWKEREASVRSFDFVWDDGIFVPQDANADERKHDRTLPRCELIIDGSDGMYSERGKMWSARANSAIASDYSQGAFRGVQTLVLFKPKAGYPVVDISRSTSLSDILAIQAAMPIILCYRILSPDFRVFDTREMRIVGETASQNGEKLVTVSFRQKNGARADLWLSRDRKWVPIRYAFVTAVGVTTLDIDISYTEDAVISWAPASWTLRTFSASGYPILVRKGKVASREAGHHVAPERLQIEIPVGAWVNDGIANNRYILLPGRRKRVLGAQEGAEDYDRIIGSNKSAFRPAVSSLFVGAP